MFNQIHLQSEKIEIPKQRGHGFDLRLVSVWGLHVSPRVFSGSPSFKYARWIWKGIVFSWWPSCKLSFSLMNWIGSSRPLHSRLGRGSGYKSIWSWNVLFPRLSQTWTWTPQPVFWTAYASPTSWPSLCQTDRWTTTHVPSANPKWPGELIAPTLKVLGRFWIILFSSPPLAQVPWLRRPRQLLHQHAAAPDCEQQRLSCPSLYLQTWLSANVAPCSFQVYEILARTVYGKRKRAEVGVDRLVNEGVYSAAFPLHEVRLPAGSTGTSCFFRLLTRVIFICFLRDISSFRNTRPAQRS